MRLRFAAFVGGLTLLGAAAATMAPPLTDEESEHADSRAAFLRPGGKWLTYKRTASQQGALVSPALGFDGAAGAARRLYAQDWSRVLGPTGLAAGPDLDASSCGSCHVETLPTSMAGIPQRIARPARLADRARYGDQVTTRFLGQRPPEARLDIQSTFTTFRYADGTERQLTAPVAYADTRDGERIPVGLRTAPLLFGWGLLERVDPNMLGHFHDPEDRNNDGISGRNPHDRGSLHGVTAALGWKASHRHLADQVTAALANDMGVESALPGLPEISDAEIEAINDFVRSLGVPDRRAGATDRGRDLFGLTGCADCHITAMLTRSDAPFGYADQLIWPYSDFMLHDMGPALADPGDAEDAAEWRTAPLWGVGFAETHLPDRGFLHDGRARDVEEAILWHGGEAEAAVDAFSTLTKRDRALLLSYVRAL